VLLELGSERRETVWFLSFTDLKIEDILY